MKNLFYLSVLVLTAGLTACASDDTNDARNYCHAGNNCGRAVAAPMPAPVPVQTVCNQPTCYQPAPQPVCNTCQPTEYTVRTPVQVVFKNTTYRTVYEPRTFETTAYETRPYNRAEVCTDGNCGYPALVSSTPM